MQHAYIIISCFNANSYKYTLSNFVVMSLMRLKFIFAFSETTSPMSARNFPPSFWDSNYVPPTPAHPQVKIYWFFALLKLVYSDIKNLFFFCHHRFPICIQQMAAIRILGCHMQLIMAVMHTLRMRTLPMPTTTIWHNMVVCFDYHSNMDIVQGNFFFAIKTETCIWRIDFFSSSLIGQTVFLWFKT